jgi:putative hemolysin
VVLVANHPHGLVDGMILADLIGRRRPDYRILTRALLTGLDESAAGYMIPVPFPHEPDAQSKMLEMRAEAMAHLDKPTG